MSVERRSHVKRVLVATAKEIVYTPKDIVVGARRNFKDVDMNGVVGLALIALVGGVVGLFTLNPIAGVATAAILYGGEFKFEGSIVRRGIVDF